MNLESKNPCAQSLPTVLHAESTEGSTASLQKIDAGFLGLTDKISYDFYGNPPLCGVSQK
jgi:hypothetical protein